MTNLDGTKTRDEHAKLILILANEYVRQGGISLPDAITKAGADYRTMLRREGDAKIAAVKKLLKIKD